MKLRQVFLPVFLLLVLGTVLSLEAIGKGDAQDSSQRMGLSFILPAMMTEQGGIYTQYQNLPSPGEDLAAGHEVLLQNTGLFMLYAVQVRDRPLFDRQVAVIQDYFLEGWLGLLHWKLDAQMQPVESSWGTYSNSPGDSLRVVKALLLADEYWRDEAYKELAAKIGEGFKNYNIAPDKTLRYYASWTPKLEPAGYGDRVVLAQLDFATMIRLAQQDESWEGILATNLEVALSGMTEQGLFEQSYLPEQKKYEQGDGSIIQMGKIAYHLAIYGRSFGDPAARDGGQRFLEFVKGEYGAKGRILGRYDPETGAPLATWENIAVYAQIARIALELEDPSFAEMIILEKILPGQQLDLQSPVYGAFTVRFDDAYAFDTLEALLALAARGSPATVTEEEPIHAVWYLGWQRESYLQPSVVDDLRQIQSRLCPNYIGLFAIANQAKKASSDPHRDPEKTASDEALYHVISQIHRMGMGVILLTPLFPDDGTWEGAIVPQDIDAWFYHWREILLHYAELAEETSVEILLLGSELVTLRDQTDEWNRLIVAIRSRYHGKLSYSVNFWANRKEYQQVLEMAQWRHMDYIGVTGYFGLTNKVDPSIKELETAWYHDRDGQDVVADLEELSNKYRKQIVFWEIAYQSKDGTNIYPWNYPRPGEVDEGEQADAWTAFLNVFRDIDWFKGYGTYAEHVGLPPNHLGYNVLGKLAEEVLRRECSE
ncbi:hypothetical protein KAX17_16690 [Candidatus Bipolaricaulota bacterium]|nr:hypothetical protein [Candidatus Bipolaricaulota bacterium]